MIEILKILSSLGLVARFPDFGVGVGVVVSSAPREEELSKCFLVSSEEKRGSNSFKGFSLGENPGEDKKLGGKTT